MSNYAQNERRAVITGMGVIAPNGKDLPSFWNTVRMGISVADIVTRFETTGLPCHIAAEIKNFNAAEYMDSKAAKRLERSQQYGLAAARLAVEDSRLDILTAAVSNRIGPELGH